MLIGSYGIWQARVEVQNVTKNVCLSVDFIEGSSTMESLVKVKGSKTVTLYTIRRGQNTICTMLPGNNYTFIFYVGSNEFDSCTRFLHGLSSNETSATGPSATSPPPQADNG